MAKLRLFANLREIAGSSRVEMPGETVGGVIAAASAEYGDDFRRGVETSRVWINGESAEMGDSVAEGDEVVLIPPVSGGSQPVSTVNAVDLMALLPLGVAIVAAVANIWGGPEIWAAALVAIAGVWALDLNAVVALRGKAFAPIAVIVTAATSAMGAHALGGAGYGLAAALAVAIVFGWAVAVPAYRDIAVFSPTLLVALFAGLGSASLVLSRSASAPDAKAVDVFLVAVIAGILLGAIVERMPALPLLDPFSVTALGAVLAAVAAAAVWDLDVVGYLLVGLGVAVALVAGRGFSSMLRTGRVALTEHPPGALASLEGAAIAASIYYPLIKLIL
jgi:molybdopterin converting factor small subunit